MEQKLKIYLMRALQVTIGLVALFLIVGMGALFFFVLLGLIGVVAIFQWLRFRGVVSSRDTWFDFDREKYRVDPDGKTTTVIETEYHVIRQEQDKPSAPGEQPEEKKE